MIHIKIAYFVCFLGKKCYWSMYCYWICLNSQITISVPASEIQYRSGSALKLYTVCYPCIMITFKAKGWTKPHQNETIY